MQLGDRRHEPLAQRRGRGRGGAGGRLGRLLRRRRGRRERRRQARVHVLGHVRDELHVGRVHDGRLIRAHGPEVGAGGARGGVAAAAHVERTPEAPALSRLRQAAHPPRTPSKRWDICVRVRRRRTLAGASPPGSGSQPQSHFEDLAAISLLKIRALPRWSLPMSVDEMYTYDECVDTDLPSYLYVQSSQQNWWAEFRHHCAHTCLFTKPMHLVKPLDWTALGCISIREYNVINLAVGSMKP